MNPDVERLRRFGLIVALVLISYAAAGVELDLEAKFSLLGLPFIVRRPDLVLLGLMLASVYALVRFYYYGVMLKHIYWVGIFWSRKLRDNAAYLRQRRSGKAAQSDCRRFPQSVEIQGERKDRGSSVR